MATKKKIFFRVLLLGGTAYLLYRNKDRIIGKVDKLSRMDNMDDILDDLTKTTGNVFNGIIDSVDDLYEYVVGGFADESGEPLNEAYKKDFFAIGSDLPVQYVSQLRSIANTLVRDIREWDNPDYDYQGTYKEKGKMPAKSFINWHNYYSLKGEGDFQRVTDMANVMLQYKAPFDMEYDTVRDLNLPTLEHYTNNPPKRFIQFNDVDWKAWNESGTPPMAYEFKPKELFRAITNKIGGGNSRIGRTGGQRTHFIQNPRMLFGRN